VYQADDGKFTIQKSKGDKLKLDESKVVEEGDELQDLDDI
jgi:hypothetical protein